MRDSLGAGATALCAGALRTAFSRQGAVRGRAAWPRLRRHLADKIRLPQIQEELIAFVLGFGRNRS